MRILLSVIAFLSGNFIYQYAQPAPDYAQAISICIYQVFAIIFMVYLHAIDKKLTIKLHIKK